VLECQQLQVALTQRVQDEQTWGRLGFDGIRETQGACRGAVGLVKSRKKIVANDENYALAA